MEEEEEEEEEVEGMTEAATGNWLNPLHLLIATCTPTDANGETPWGETVANTTFHTKSFINQWDTVRYSLVVDDLEIVVCGSSRLHICRVTGKFCSLLFKTLKLHHSLVEQIIYLLSNKDNESEREILYVYVSIEEI